VQNTAELLLSIVPHAGIPVAEPPKLHFAVGTFDSWQQLGEGLHDLPARGFVLDSFNCVALQRLFAGKTIVAPNQESVAVAALPFDEGSALIACTSGPLADCLLDRIDSGAHDLKDALSRWLLQRHAVYFQECGAGWPKSCSGSGLAMHTTNGRAYQTLLSHSSNSVGVHDPTLPGER
jgi:hypothetical protein